MRKILSTTILFLTAAVAGWAQSQVAVITSTEPFELRGASVTPGQGVPSWPAMPGDAVKAGSTPLTLTYADGSTLVLDPASTAKVDFSGQTPVFRLQTGSAHYTLKSVTAVQLMENDKTVTTENLTGTLTIDHHRRAAGAATAGGISTKVAVVAGAAAATGIGVGIAQATSRGGHPLSAGH